LTGSPLLLAVPNLSEGRDRGLVERLARAFTSATVRLLDTHCDPDHNRTVLTLAGRPGELAHALAAGAREVVRRVDIRGHEGAHPRVGALDVAPIVYLAESELGAACAEALVLADMLADELRLPVFLYGRLAGGRPRAELRRGGPEALARRIAAGELTPAFGPPRLHPTAGATLVAARPPLIAFNVELAPPATLADARAIAAAIREGGEAGLRGVRAIGVWLERRGRAQVSTNVEDHLATPLSEVIAAIAIRARIAEAELVGLAPQAALDGLPPDIVLRGARAIEDALAATGATSQATGATSPAGGATSQATGATSPATDEATH
jgi:glutamate formiminotransferase